MIHFNYNVDFVGQIGYQFWPKILKMVIILSVHISICGFKLFIIIRLTLIQIIGMKCILLLYIITQLAASFYIQLHISQEIFNNYLVLVTVATLIYIATSLKDPGYYDPTRIKTQTSESQCEVVDNQAQKCKECNIQQLLRMKHCQDCGLCVATFDHHCIWIDNCVGQKNRPFFILCLLTNVIEIGYAMFQLIAAMWQKGEKFTTQIVFLSFLGIVLSGVMVLLGMHCYLMAVNLTTREILRWDKIEYLGTRSKGEGSPFSRGILGNLRDYWFQGFTHKFKTWRIEQKQNQDISTQQTQNESRQQTSGKDIFK